jgi:hypothetical protein
LGIRKLEIEKGQPWQSYLQTAWGVQRRMADHYYFARAEDWAGLLEEHDRWMNDYNVQEHYAHQHRKEKAEGRLPKSSRGLGRHATGKRTSPGRSLLGPLHAHPRWPRLHLVLQRFRLYAEEGLAGTEVAVWVAEDALTVEYGGEALCRYEVECEPAGGV